MSPLKFIYGPCCKFFWLASFLYLFLISYLKNHTIRPNLDSKTYTHNQLSTTFLFLFVSISLMMSCSGSLKLEIHTDDKTPGKWSVPLGDDVFRRFLSGGGGSEKAVFGEGSLFSPFLFGKYFDPSDAFPLWEFEAEVLLASLRSLGGQCRVDWSQTDLAYVLKSDIPVVGKNYVQVYVDVNGKVMEISGQWNNNKKAAANGDWRSGRWWEHGYVRRLELPCDADAKNSEAFLSNNDDYSFLEIRIPKINSKNKF